MGEGGEGFEARGCDSEAHRMAHQRLYPVRDLVFFSVPDVLPCMLSPPCPLVSCASPPTPPLSPCPANPRTSTGRYTIELPAVSAALLIVRRVRDDEIAQEDGEREAEVA